MAAIYVEDYTGTDTEKINKALDDVRAAASNTQIPQRFAPALIFGSKVYEVTDTLNFTGIRAMNWPVYGQGATLLAKTNGKPVIDLMHNRWWTMRDLNIWGDENFTPSYGIQCGRVQDGVSCGDATFDEIHIQGHFNKACLYNFASETVTYRHNRFYNKSTAAGSYCVILDSANNQGITSEFQTQTLAQGTNQSFNEQRFEMADIRKANGGTPILLTGDSMARIGFYDSYGVSVDSSIVKIENCKKLQGLVLDIHAETFGCKKFLEIDNVTPSSNIVIFGLKIRDHAPYCEDSMIDLTGSIKTVLFPHMDLDFGEPKNTVPVFGYTSLNPNKIQATGSIKWASNRDLDISNCRFNGDVYTRETGIINKPLGGYREFMTPNVKEKHATRLHGKLFAPDLPSGINEAQAEAVKDEIWVDTSGEDSVKRGE